MAIILIGVLFTSNLGATPLFVAIALLGALFAVGRRTALPVWLYPFVAIVTWALAKESGVHTSVMAVAAAMIVPPRPTATDETLIGKLEHAIHPFSAFVVLPVFAFCAAGVSFEGLSLAQLTGGVSSAIAFALVFGKPLGVTVFALAAAHLARMPLPFSLRQIVGIGCLCGIGFTMSLFIGGLAFAGDETGEAAARLGVLMGSTLSLVMAAAVYRLWPDKKN